jgi:bifunctional enzyme CysN/CysC
MVTGVSTADLAVVLVDARRGLVEQSRRHAFVATLLRVPHLVVAVNKMDLVGWSQQVFEAVRDDVERFAAKLEVHDLTLVPLSALHGDNVVERSAHMPWYEGPTLLHHLEHVHVAGDRNLIDARFPVQYVIRPQSASHPDYRGYAGTVASGVFKPGDEVMVLPSGLTTRITAIDTADGPVAEAFPPMAVTLRLEDDLDVSRGDLVCRPHNAPAVTQDLEAMVCWMSDRPLEPGRKLAHKHTTRWARALVKDVRYGVDVDTLHRRDVQGLGLNEVGRVVLRTTVPVLADPYRRNRATGGFVLVDEATNVTVGAGMVVDNA